jgi:pyridoxal phosphate enzyme (YggS family)
VARLTADRVRSNLERVHERIERAGGDPAAIEICEAIKARPAAALPALAEGGITIVGENRAQELVAKQELHRELFEWHFIGALQSRKVKDVAPRVTLIHSVASVSALRKLETHPAPEVLIEVNLAQEEGKEGIDPGDLDEFIARSTVPVTGLMTMPPLTDDPQRSRRWFAELAELASAHGLERLSMGTTQDFEAAVAEGATILRLGTVLYE